MGIGSSIAKKEEGASVNLYFIMNLTRVFINHADEKGCYMRYKELIESKCIGGNFAIDHLGMKIIFKNDKIFMFNNDIENPKIKFLFGLDDIDENTNILIDRKTSDYLEEFILFLNVESTGYVKLLSWVN